MTKNYDEYRESIEDDMNDRVYGIFTDIDEELQNIERYMETESSRILLSWVKDTILRMREDYLNTSKL